MTPSKVALLVEVRLLRGLAAAAALLFFRADSAWGYIDPGTGGYVFSMVAPVLAMAGAALAFVFKPVRRLFASLFHLLKPGRADSRAAGPDKE
jgi:hypothetical protein